MVTKQFTINQLDMEMTDHQAIQMITLPLNKMIIVINVSLISSIHNIFCLAIYSNYIHSETALKQKHPT